MCVAVWESANCTLQVFITTNYKVFKYDQQEKKQKIRKFQVCT